MFDVAMDALQFGEQSTAKNAIEREFVQASVMVKLTMSFAAGQFCIQVVADGAEDVLIAQSMIFIADTLKRIQRQRMGANKNRLLKKL
jgi:hypothetical protein